MTTTSAGINLPRAGEIWQSGPPHHLNVRVLGVELHTNPPVVEYEVLDDDGSSLTGPLRLELDANWHATFSRPMAAPLA